MRNSFHLKIQERTGVTYDGDVLSITSFSDAGEFDVLPDHANFISLIKNKLIIREQKGEPRQINFDNALIRVSNNFAEVYVGVEGTIGESA